MDTVKVLSVNLILFVIVDLWDTALGAKQCPSLIVTGALHNKQLDGHYVVSEQYCHGDVVYRKQVSGNISNSEALLYLHRYWRSLFSYGWAIGEGDCDDMRDESYIYQHNVKDRPDRKFGPWIERDDNWWWWENHDFKVTCSEGLEYGALFGIAFSCTFVGVVLLISIPFIVSAVKKKRRPRRSTTSSDLSNRDVNYGTTQVDNPTYDGDGHMSSSVPMPDFCVMDPPSYQEALSIIGPDLAKQSTVLDGSMPPPYMAPSYPMPAPAHDGQAAPQ